MEVINVIYINDDSLEADIARLHLQRQYINVLHIQDPSAAGLAVLNEQEYQNAKAILIDMYLGGYYGLEIAQQLRDAGDTRPFYLVTSGERPDQELLNELALTFVQTPPNFVQLAQMIRDAIDDT
ncbi:MAG: response regulator [Chloroflexi bacterium]|nr:MAG: hypothetical protein CUN54_07815 [Phototrophicales bacterium]RMF82673.1 MAG: response regulator [Chloroflexota bacterium]